MVGYSRSFFFVPRYTGGRFDNPWGTKRLQRPMNGVFCTFPNFYFKKTTTFTCSKS